MPKKDPDTVSGEKLVMLITFWSDKVEKWFFLSDPYFLLEIEKIWALRNFDPPNRRWGAIFNWKAPRNVVFLSLELLWGYEGVPTYRNFWQHTLGVLLLKNNIFCFCCQKLMILWISEKNRHHKWKLSSVTRWRQKFRSKFLPEGLRPICCQFVILLKFYQWQHIWSWKPIFKKCRKIAHFGIFQNFQKISNFHFLSFWAIRRIPLATPINTATL